MHDLAEGSAMYLPADVPHRFRIAGAKPARILAIPAASSTSIGR
jgi:quercetin dioxygenase-like cupin family protein